MAEDGFGELASAFNQMAEDLDLQEYQDWVEKFYGAVGEMPQTTLGDWQLQRVCMADLLKLQHEEKQ